MDRMEQRMLSLLDTHREALLAFAEDIRLHPEGGFREVRTAGKLAEWFRRCGLPVETGLAVTGVRAKLVSERVADASAAADTGAGRHLGGTEEKPVRIMIMGELDAVGSDHHPDADPQTGMAHACGHHAQLGVLAGVALALSDPEVASSLGGEAVFLGVPAEEGMAADWKHELLATDRIRTQSGGKAELIRLGVMDGVDAVLAHHVHFFDTASDLLVGNNSTNGYVTLLVTVTGKAAHAGSEPHLGVNALNAATLGLQAVAFLRETFREEDAVRIHGLVTKGGSAVNIVPDEVTLELMVRAKTYEAVRDAADRTTAAFRHAAQAIGAKARVEELPGYLPVIGSRPDPTQLQAAEVLAGAMADAGKSVRLDPVPEGKHNPLSTDVGDLTHLLPVLHITSGGYAGKLHAADFKVTDPEVAILLPAKLAALTAYRLLKDGGAEARRLRNEFVPKWTKQAYLSYLGVKDDVDSGNG